MLKAAYPYNYNRMSHSALISVAVGVFIFLFSLIIKPFDVNELVSQNVPLLSLIYGAISALNCGLFLILLPLLFPRYFSESKWTVGKEIFWIGVLLMFISLSNYLMHQYTFTPSVKAEIGQARLLGETLLNTFFIGMIPTVVVVLTNQIRLVKKHSGSDRIATDIKSSQITRTDSFRLDGDNQNESLEINFRDFYFAQAEGNYVEIRFSEHGVLQKRVIRATLTNIENQLSDYAEIKRVHRKYLANFSNINQVSGNAQGYKLHYLDNLDPVPVSRQKSKELFRASQ